MHDEHLNPAGGRVVDCASDDICRMVSCEVCLKEVPGDAAVSADVQDYVHHFCGLDCLRTWRERAGRPA
jgi:hypothetical protein